MSGGSFDYAFARVTQFAEELSVKLDNHDKPNAYGDTPYDYRPDVLAKLREIEKIVRRVSALMKEVEWLYSGDTGEESFLERVGEVP